MVYKNLLTGYGVVGAIPCCYGGGTSKHGTRRRRKEEEEEEGEFYRRMQDQRLEETIMVLS